MPRAPGPTTSRDACGVAPLGIEPKRRTMVQLRVGRSGLKDLPLVDDCDGRFYFKGEGDRTIWLSPHDEIATDPCDAAPEEIDIATAIDRFEGVVDWPVEAVERKWAGLRSFAPDRLPVYGFDRARAGLLLVRRAGRLRHPDRAGGGEAGGGACCLDEAPDPMVAHIDPAHLLAARVSTELTSGGGCAGVGFGAGERVDAVVLGMAAVALDPMPFDPVRRRGVDQLLPQLGILDRLPVRGAPAVLPPSVDPARDPVADINAVGVELRRGTGASAPRARESRRAAPSGCWWSAPRRRQSRAPCRRSAAATAQPPGPGIAPARAVGEHVDAWKLAHVRRRARAEA